MAPLRWLPLVFLLVFLPLNDTHPQTPQSAYDHALRLLQQGNLMDGQREAALDYQRFESSNPAWAAKFRLLLAQALLYQGMNDAALDTLSSYDDPKNQEFTIQKLAIAAVALTRQQRFALADQRLVQAETICNKADLAPCGDVDTAEAIFDAKQGRLAEAQQYFLRALAVARSHSNSWLEASATLNMGFMAMQVGHFDEAIDWSRSAYRKASASGYQYLMEASAGNLGWAYYQSGDDERALEQFLAAETAAAHVGSLRDQLKWVSDTGYIYRDSGDWPRAMDDYRKAFSIAKELDSREGIENALEDLAQLSVANGDMRDAGSYIEQATPLETMEGQSISPNLMLTKGMLAAALHQDAVAETDFRSVWNHLGSLTTLHLGAGYHLAELYQAEGRIGAAEQMYKSTLTAYESARATLRKEETQLPFGANATKVYDNYIRLLIEQKRIGEALAIATQSRARTLEQSLDAEPRKRSLRNAAIDPQRIARTADATLLFYWLGDTQSYLWAITPSRIAMFLLPPQQQISARVDSYRNAILRLQNPRATSNQDGQWLCRVLVAPAKALIRPQKPVVVLADGSLSELNFETLLASGPGSRKDSDPNETVHYLLEDLTLISAPSLAMLGSPKIKRNVGIKMLLFGDPVSTSQDFPSLPLFGFEMTKIESHFGKDQLSVFEGKHATPTAYFMSHPSQYSYIHFVSHAIASRTDPLDSAIILSSSDADQNSFKLYARDIIKERIDAQLVTISACYGSGTRFYAGEGLVGLSWAFFRAGAQRVIGALWEVSDVSTPHLMDSLYRNLANGSSPEASLRAAKLEMIRAGGRFSLPFYWAVFQMYDRD